MAKKSKHGELIKFINEVALVYDGNECLFWPFGKNKDGYGVVHIDGSCRNVHRVVCERVYGEPPTERHQAAHLCGNGLSGCCNKKHLGWKTPAENIADKVGHGTSNRGTKNPRAKLSEIEVRKIRELSASTPTADLARSFSVAKGTVYAIVNRQIWRWLA